MIAERYYQVFGLTALDMTAKMIESVTPEHLLSYGWGFASRIPKFIVLQIVLETYNLPSEKDLAARQAVCQKLTDKTFQFVWASLAPASHLLPSIISFHPLYDLPPCLFDATLFSLSPLFSFPSLCIRNLFHNNCSLASKVSFTSYHRE